MTDFRVGVLGLGGIGSAAVYWASRRVGGDVLGVEQFGLGHVRGGSEDHSRIIRLSYHTPGYVELAKAAYLAWEEVEVDSGEPLVLTTGGLDLAPQDAAIGLEDYRASMSAAGVEFEELDAGGVMRRWPQWRLNDDVMALFQERSGIAMASRANSTHRRLAVEHGATLMDGSEVGSIREVDGEVEMLVGGRPERVGSLIIAAGAWTAPLLAGLGFRVPLQVTLEQVVYLDPRDLLQFHPSRFPIWIWMDEPSFYGFPVFGERAVKVAWDRCEILTDPETRSFQPRSDVTDAVSGFAARYLPGAAGPVRVAKTCLYTLTPDRDFIVDRVPGTENIYAVVGAGHAFKFASLLGKILVDLALDDATDHDISPFRADRPILAEESPVRSYMV
ncbi:MAG TPA: N-methyl-L-tryptophan oxidase [Acidimicrobiia bacterium]|nr:N-methyl-L-tryptophan oxidase [Acidimicrobiia bacterium]